MIEVGSQAPNFSLHKSKTETVNLKDLRGKNVVIAFFPAAFTPVCEKELCTFRDAHAQLSELNAEVFGICVDGPFANAAFAAKNELNFPLLSDYTRSTVTAYGVNHDDFAGLSGYTAAKRSVFIVDKEGIVRYAWIAANPGVEPNYDEITETVSGLS
jgi:peroxiredoxin